MAKALPHYFSKEWVEQNLEEQKPKYAGKLEKRFTKLLVMMMGRSFKKVYQAPESREYTNTEPQAKARMIMGQIERMFHILPDVIKYAFATIPNGSLSFQHFSKLNYDLLKQDQNDNWQYWSQFDWRAKRDMTAPQVYGNSPRALSQRFTHNRIHRSWSGITM